MIIMVALEKCGRELLNSIAFPAIGMGAKGYSSSVVANTMIKAITLFCNSHPKTSVNKVVLYLNPDHIPSEQLKVCTIFKNHTIVKFTVAVSSTVMDLAERAGGEQSVSQLTQ